MNYRLLWPEKVAETMEGLRQRIGQKFPDAGLYQLAGELRQVIAEAVATTARIRRPNYLLRAGVAVLIIGLAALVIRVALQLRWSPEHLQEVPTLVQFTDSSLASVVFLSAGIAFLLNIERRMKRTRALRAFHELRALAHIVDMHQLRKSPDRFLHAGSESRSQPGPGLLLPLEMTYYLEYCTELLSIISKVAALYVQDFPDSEAVNAADQIETLTTGFSRKIWQKISLLNLGRKQESSEADDTPVEEQEAENAALPSRTAISPAEG